MQVVLLAAGMSKRLRPLTDSRPKCLLDVSGKTMLERTLDALRSIGLADFVIVTGYRAGMIRQAVDARYPDLSVTWIVNDRFAETNNAYSLMLAEGAVRGPFVLLDSDILFPPGLVQAVIDFPRRPCLALDRHPCGEEEIKILLDQQGEVRDIGKDVPPSRAAGESTGVEVFSEPGRHELFRVLRRRIVDERRENEFYEASFREMIRNGVTFHAVDTTAFSAMEVDTPEDLERARAMFRPGR
jgi:choline kinase